MGSDTLSPRVRRWYDRFVPFRARHSQLDPDGSTEAGPPGAAGGQESGFSSLSGADGPASLSAEDLAAWENRDVPSIDRVSDGAEARADEKQDRTSSLNFPLHWTTCRAELELSVRLFSRVRAARASP